MLLQFSHGNGFPAGCYRAFFKALEVLAPAITIRAVERIGHDSRFPITDKWPHLVEELVERIDSRDAALGPLVLAGHSLGGYLSLMAAYARPHAVSAVLLLDSPIVPRWKATMLALAKKTGLDEHISPAGMTKTRRNHWPDRAAAHAHFRAKSLFEAFDPAALNDYLDAGLVHSASGAKLAFERERETLIYRTLPHHLHGVTRQPPPCPVGFIGGTRSTELRMAGTAATRRFVGPHFRMIKGGHLFTMERPRAAAEAAVAMLAELGVLPRVA